MRRYLIGFHGKYVTHKCDTEANKESTNDCFCLNLAFHACMKGSVKWVGELCLFVIFVTGAEGSSSPNAIKSWNKGSQSELIWLQHLSSPQVKCLIMMRQTNHTRGNRRTVSLCGRDRVCMYLPWYLHVCPLYSSVHQCVFVWLFQCGADESRRHACMVSL